MATASELLTKVETTIENRLDGGTAVENYSIDGLSVQRMPLNDLMDLRDRLRREVAAGNRSPFQFADLSGRVS